MIKILQLYFTILSFFFNYVQDKTFLLFYRKRKKKPNAGFKSKKIQPQEDSDELPIITNIDDPWQEESEEDEKIGVSINTAGKTTELVIVENGVKREEGVHTSHVQVEESAISKSSIGDSSPEVQVEAEIVPEMVALSVIVQQTEQNKTANGEVSTLEGEVQRETPEKEGGIEGAGTIEGPLVTIEETADPIVTVEIEVSQFGGALCVKYKVCFC